LQTTIAFGQLVMPLPPEHSAKPQLDAPVQSIKHGVLPVQTTVSQLEAPLQSMSQLVPLQFALRLGNLHPPIRQSA
jgi:hypothetical protein